MVLVQILLAAGVLAHGIPKLMSLQATLKFFHKQGYGYAVGAYTVFTETVVAFLLLVGVFPRIMAVLLAMNFLGAMFHHWRNKEPFDGGWEVAFLYFGLSVVVVLAGNGWF